MTITVALNDKQISKVQQVNITSVNHHNFRHIAIRNSHQDTSASPKQEHSSPSMDRDKHRISDARWRDSVSRCYSLLNHCSNVPSKKTRMSTLKLTLDEILLMERKIAEFGYLSHIKHLFEEGETSMINDQ